MPRNLDKAWRRLASGSGSDTLKALLLFQDNPGFTRYYDDFVGTGAGTWPASQNWSYPATQGTGTEVIGVTTAAIGGVLTVTSGGTTNDTAHQTVGLHWRGTEGWYYINRAKMGSTSSAKMEVGVTDALTGVQVINAKATPTFIATDGAVFIFDTTDDTNLTFITINAGVVGANADAANFTMDTNYHIYELVGQGSQVSGYADGQLIGAGAITSTAPLTPCVTSVTRTGSAKTVSADFMGMVGPKYA